MDFYITAVILGLCLASMSVGIFISMKIFNIPDITTDGSYTLGAALTAILLVHHWAPAFIIPSVIIGGAAAGAVTGIIHTQLKVEPLLAGILTMTGLYSINLIILGRSNVPLINITSIFSFLHLFHNAIFNDFLTAAFFIFVIIFIIAYVLKTDFGIAMRATGNSPAMVSAQGINVNMMKITGLALSNGLTALSGYLVAQYQNFTDINMGIGIVISGLGSVLMGDVLIRLFNIRGVALQLCLVAAGSLVMQLVLAFTLTIGIDPNLLKLVTSAFVLMIVAIPRLKMIRKW